MKKLLIALLTICFITSVSAYTPPRSKKSSTAKSHHSGTYKGGKGSSHKGGSYKNTSTNNHYSKRK